MARLLLMLYDDDGDGKLSAEEELPAAVAGVAAALFAFSNAVEVLGTDFTPAERAEAARQLALELEALADTLERPAVDLHVLEAWLRLIDGDHTAVPPEALGDPVPGPEAIGATTPRCATLSSPGPPTLVLPPTPSAGAHLLASPLRLRRYAPIGETDGSGDEPRLLTSGSPAVSSSPRLPPAAAPPPAAADADPAAATHSQTWASGSSTSWWPSRSTSAPPTSRTLRHMTTPSAAARHA